MVPLSLTSIFSTFSLSFLIYRLGSFGGAEGLMNAKFIKNLLLLRKFVSLTSEELLLGIEELLRLLILLVNKIKNVST